MEVFWACWRIGVGMAKRKHASKEAAIEEARRLSVKEEAPIAVVECIGCAFGENYISARPEEIDSQGS